MKRNLCLLVLFLLTYSGVLPLTSRAIDRKNNLGAEELYFIDIPSVIGAARREQIASKTPASVKVNTANRKASGATNKTNKDSAR